MIEIVDIGSLELRFLQTKETTGGSVDVFEMTLQPDARMPVPHYHESWDETIYGLSGESTWRIDGRDVALRPGETLFIGRGTVHGFVNASAAPATCLCILTPGRLGSAYFREMADLVAAGRPDPAKLRETMLRHGLVPVPDAAGEAPAR